MTLTLLLLKGPVGIGKSTLARALGKQLGWVVVDKDDTSDILMKQLETYGALAYGVMFKQAESLLVQGFNVIVDSPLRGELGLENALKIATINQAEVKVLDCFCSDEGIWKTRLETRTRRPAHVLKTWQDFEHYWQTAKKDFDYAVKQPKLKVDTKRSLNENVSRITAWLNT